MWRNQKGDLLQESNHVGTLTSHFLPLEIGELNVVQATQSLVVCYGSQNWPGPMVWPYSSGSCFGPLPPPHAEECLQRGFLFLSPQLFTPPTEAWVNNQMDHSMKLIGSGTVGKGVLFIKGSVWGPTSLTYCCTWGSYCLLSASSKHTRKDYRPAFRPPCDQLEKSCQSHFIVATWFRFWIEHGWQNTLAPELRSAQP